MPSQSEIRQQIADQIVDALSCGDVPPRRKPWTNDRNTGLPANTLSGNRYRGVNPILLEINRMKQGFESKWWATYRQIQQLGESVCKGQKGTSVIFYKKYKVTKPDPKTGEEKEDRRELLVGQPEGVISPLRGHRTPFLRCQSTRDFLFAG